MKGTELCMSLHHCLKLSPVGAEAPYTRTGSRGGPEQDGGCGGSCCRGLRAEAGMWGPLVLALGVGDGRHPSLSLKDKPFSP